ncbi:MAG TPA: acyl-CoA dehydrogenase, partial [Longimicrobium sp.]|nr:acyl-CoA dehydrogenase [Longimicrobium sp.]
CRVPKENLLGRPGFGVSHVISAALEHGRYSVAWGSVGLGQACLDASKTYAAGRRQFGVPIADHQLIRRMLTNMIVEVRAARLLCLRAGWLRDAGDPGASGEIMVAKYYASTMATRAANDAVQIHGANGCSEEYPVGRYLRDSRVMEIIEGSTQIQQVTLGRWEVERAAGNGVPSAK